MNQKTITYWLKAVVISVGLLGLAFFAGATAYAYYYKPDYDYLLPVYLRQNIVALWISAAICLVILYFCWRIVNEIGKDNYFSMENVKSFKNMGICGVILIINNVIRIFVWLFRNQMGLIQLSYTLLKIVAIVIYVIMCLAMSKLVQNAYEIKKENELTI